MKKKICVITGSRAEYGLLYPLLKELEQSDEFELQILATGMHLSPEFGLTYKEIEKDGFIISEKIEMLLSSDSDSGISKSVGLGMIGYADALNRLKPHLIIVLGDRFETFAAVVAGYLAKIPIAHLHGGETTEGATDEGLRHAISKMAYWHFTSTEEYRKRVIQLGESPERVFNVGAIGIDNIQNIDFMTTEELSESLNFNVNLPYFLVTYHPVTLENNSAEHQFGELLNALSNFADYQIIITKPNADANGRIIIQKIDDFVKNHERVSAHVSLGQKRYLSLMKNCELVIGNSSSGIIEAPSFHVPTINIGDRQKGRTQSKSIINTSPKAKDIEAGIRKGLSNEFKKSIENSQNPYGSGNVAKKIIDILNNSPFPQTLKKSFYDL